MYPTQSSSFQAAAHRFTYSKWHIAIALIIIPRGCTAGTGVRQRLSGWLPLYGVIVCTIHVRLRHKSIKICASHTFISTNQPVALAEVLSISINSTWHLPGMSQRCCPPLVQLHATVIIFGSGTDLLHDHCSSGIAVVFGKVDFCSKNWDGTSASIQLVRSEVYFE